MTTMPNIITRPLADDASQAFGGGKSFHIHNPRFHYQMLDLPGFGECYFRPFSISPERYPFALLAHHEVQTAIKSGALQVQFSPLLTEGVHHG